MFSGIGTGFMFISAVTAVTRWFSTKRSLATGLAVCGAGFGVFGFAPLVRILLTNYDRQGALLIEGALAFQGCVFALLLRPVPSESLIKRTARAKQRIPLKVYVGPHQNVYLCARNAHSNGNEEIRPLQEIPTLTILDPISKSPMVADAANMKSVLTNWIFWAFAVSQFLTFFSASAPLVFLYNRAVKDLAIERMHASYVISIMGIFNTVGRLIFGVLGNSFPKSRLFLLSGAIMAYGGATAVSVFGTSFWSITAFSAVFGTGYGKGIIRYSHRTLTKLCNSTVGCMFALTTVVLVDFFGVTIFSTLYGNIGIFRGIACLIGPPFGGKSLEKLIFLLLAISGTAP